MNIIQNLSNEIRLIECYETRKEITDIAQELQKSKGYEIVRCRQYCEKLTASRNAILVINGNEIIKRLLSCKTCKNIKQLNNNIVK